MPGTVLVTGATGTVGREVVKRLVSRGTAVRAALHSTAHAEVLEGFDVETAIVGKSHPGRLQGAFRDVDRLFLLVPFTPDLVAITRTLVEAAKAARIETIVKLSVLGTDVQPPPTTVAKWHRHADMIVEDSGLGFTLLHSNAFMQNMVPPCVRALRGDGIVRLPLGQARVSYIGARDIGVAAAAVLTGEGFRNKRYTLTGRDALTVQEMTDAVSEVLGRNVRYLGVNADEARHLLKSDGTPDWLAEAMLEVYAEQRAGHAAHLTTSLEQITGKPPNSFMQFARDARSLLLPS